MYAQKINVKYYLENGGDLLPEVWFKTFNSWISEPDDDILVDIHNYNHMATGPVMLLVGHYGNYSIDNNLGRPGFLYSRKQFLEGDFLERLGAIFLITFKACRRIEQDLNLKDQVTFRGNELQLVLNDRLLAPNTEKTFETLLPDLKNMLNIIYPGGAVNFERNPNLKERFTLDIKVEGTWDMETLLENIEA